MTRTALIGLWFAALAGLTVSPGFAAQSTDTTYQINAAHTGQVTFAKPLTPPLKLKWKTNFGGGYGTVSYPLIANGIVYVTAENLTTGNSTLLALSLKNGSTIWSKPISGSYGFSFATYDNGRVFDVSSDGLTQAYSAEFGTLLWSQNVRTINAGQFFYPPIAADGRLFTGGNGGGGTIFALNETTGAIIWNAPLPNGIGTPTYGDGGIYIDTYCNYSKNNATNGSLDWYQTTGCTGGSNYTPVYYQQRVFDIDVVPIELNSANGKYVRDFDADCPPAIWPAVKGATLLIAPDSHAPSNLVAYNESTGRTAWTFTGDGGFGAPAIVIGDIVAIGSENGTLYLLNAETGAVLWSTSVGAPIGAALQYFQAMGAAEQTLVVPAGGTLSAYVSAKK